MEASGFRSDRCCRSRRLRKQSRGTHQTVPPGCGSPASCEGVRPAHQKQTRCTLERRIQWKHPWARRLGTAHCDARFGDVLRLCRDERRRLWSPLLHLGKVSKLASVVHRNGLKDLGAVFAILVMELIHEVHDRLAGCARNTERKVGFRLFLQQRKDNRLFSGTLANHSIALPMALFKTEGCNFRML